MSFFQPFSTGRKATLPPPTPPTPPPSYLLREATASELPCTFPPFIALEAGAPCQADENRKEYDARAARSYSSSSFRNEMRKEIRRACGLSSPLPPAPLKVAPATKIFLWPFLFPSRNANELINPLAPPLFFPSPPSQMPPRSG